MSRYRKFDGMVIDCDGHISEPQDLWDNYAEPRYRAAANDTMFVYDYPEGGFAMVVKGKTWGGPTNTAGSAGIRPFELDRHYRDMEPGGFNPHD